jgi:hypothetical protein
MPVDPAEGVDLADARDAAGMLVKMGLVVPMDAWCDDMVARANRDRLSQV